MAVIEIPTLWFRLDCGHDEASPPSPLAAVVGARLFRLATDSLIRVPL